jgi:CheY-like chemotaxis protein
MDKSLVYSKTAKGMAEYKSGGKSLAREHARILSLVNGKASIGDLLTSGCLLEGRYAVTVESLVELGLIRVFERSKHHGDALEWTAGLEDDDVSDLLPALTVEELSPQESVQIWAQARRGAGELKTTGFYSYGSNAPLSLAEGDVGLRALVVEDDEEMAELLVVLLSEKGILVDVAADVPQALAAIHKGAPPAMVLLDIVLPGQPGKDGFDVLAYIRRQQAWSRVPVIMVTSEVSDDQVMKGLKAGADGYMFKPFKWESLYGLIQQTLGI